MSTDPHYDDIVCKWCGSKYWILKEVRENKIAPSVRRFLCKNPNCGRGFSNGRRALTAEEAYRVLEMYYRHSRHLESIPRDRFFPTEIDLVRKVGRRRQALSALVRKEGIMCRGPIDISFRKMSQIGPFLGFDIKHITRAKTKKRSKITYYVWIAVDLQNNDPIHYMVSTSKNGEVAQQFISEIKHGLPGYSPAVIVSDLEDVFLSIPKDAWPRAKHQGCVAHRLNEIYDLLPIERKNMDEEKFKKYMAFRDLVAKLLYADNHLEKARLLGELREKMRDWSTDDKIKEAYDGLNNNNCYYLTKDELSGCPHTNNIVEERNREIEELDKLHKGIKGFEALVHHVKAYWAIKRTDSKHPDLSLVFDLEKRAIRDARLWSNSGRRKRRADECDCKHSAAIRTIPVLPLPRPALPFITIPSTRSNSSEIQVCTSTPSILQGIQLKINSGKRISTKERIMYFSSLYPSQSLEQWYQ